MADTAVVGSFGRESAASYAFDLAGVTAVAAPGVEVALAGDLPLDLGDGGSQVLRGKRPPDRRSGGARSAACGWG
ncbi:hypothetical protein SCWH03_25880 [Streptomyces pacificus]|uniref:Uncharacterized protein n=1 Tax=Streptomyces pacificus TaxID=2705029 RepID=A0A6A0ATX1_9ACTN|nr:hypothetical protein SCWH03_25880 [Streptomyces pacificus]